MKIEIDDIASENYLVPPLSLQLLIENAIKHNQFLEKNPLDDIKNTESVSYTMVNGRLYNCETMNEEGNHPHPRGKFYWEQGLR